MRRYASLRGQREFALVVRHGKAVSFNALSVKALAPRGDTPAKLGIVITKKVGNAVVRNRLRRRCKAIVDEFDLEGQRHWFLIHCRPEAAHLSFATLRTQLLRALDASRTRVSRAAPGEREARR